MRVLLQRVAVQVWIVLFIVFFGAEVVHLESSLRIVTHVLFGLPLVAWTAARLRGPWDRLDLAVGAALAMFLVVAIAGRDRTESLNAVGLATAYAALFLVLRREARGAWRQPLVQAVTTGLLATLLLNAWLLVDEKIQLLAAVGGAPWEGVSVFPWESVNALPILVALSVPFVAWMPAGTARRLVGAGVLVSTVVVVPLSMGRAGWLALTVMVLAYALLRPGTPAALRRWSPAMRMGAALAVVLGTTAAFIYALPRVLDILESSARLLIWEQAAIMVGDRPLLGFGPGAYAWSRLEFAADGANLVAVRLVHNVPLQTLLDGGIVLLATVVVLLAVWGRAIWRRRSTLTPPDRWALAALIGLASALWLDDFSYLPATTALGVGIGAFLVPAAQISRPRKSGRSLGPLPFLVLAFLAALPSVVGVDLARANSQAARNHAVRGEWDDAALSFERATRWHPENAGYWLGLGMARSHRGDIGGAVDAYVQARDAAPGDARAYAALAQLADETSDQLALLSAAADRSLGDPLYAVRLALVQEASGDIEGAVESWGRAIALDTRVFDLLQEIAPSVDRTRAGEVALQVIAEDRRPEIALRWDIELALGRLSHDAGAAWRSIAAAQEASFARAEGLARSVIEDKPYSAVGYWAIAAVAQFKCDSGTAEWALGLEPNTQDAYVPLPKEPSVRREFVFREASLGSTQPAGALEREDPGLWPWYLVPTPEPCAE